MEIPVNKNLSIASYILNAILAIVVAVLLIANCTRKAQESKTNTIAESIIESEKAKLPLVEQSFGNMYSIAINDMTFTNDAQKPYTGYLTTIWTSRNGEDTVFVEVDSISVSHSKPMYHIDWESAFKSHMINLLNR